MKLHLPVTITGTFSGVHPLLGSLVVAGKRTLVHKDSGAMQFTSTQKVFFDIESHNSIRTSLTCNTVLFCALHTAVQIEPAWLASRQAKEAASGTP